MNQQTPGFSQFSSLSQGPYTYSPPNAYPASQQQTPYAYAVPPPVNALQQQSTLQQQQAIQQNARALQQGLTPQPLYHPFAQPSSNGLGPVQQQAQQPQRSPPTHAQLQQQQQGSFPAKPPQPSGSRRKASNQPQQQQQQQRQDDGPPAGPGAPPPDASSPDLEDQLRDALQRDRQIDPDRDGLNNDNDNDDDENNDDEEDENEPIFNLPPPPEGSYPGEQQLEDSIHAWSLEHGYEVVRRASKKNAGGVIYKRYYHCSKHGKLANTGKLTDSSRVRVRRKSNRMGCPMSLAAVAVEPNNPSGEWQIRHRKTHHNHGPMNALALAGHRRRARMGGVEKAVDGLFQIGTPTTQVLQFLQKTNPDGLFTRTDVANMKLKWKKHGTCVHVTGPYVRNPAKRDGGLPHACMRCREKRTRCDSARPICGTCVQHSWTCEYDFERDPDDVFNQPQQDTPGADVTIDLEAGDGQGTRTAQRGNGGRHALTTLGVQRAQAEQILADLQNFQAEHIKPKRLDLTSSSVEILAQSSCGNCDSYKTVPTLFTNADWRSFSEAFLEASMKENTASTLTGERSEPLPPAGAASHDGNLSDVEVEEWNEYIKQLAIFHRRNSALLGALWGAMAPGFRTRIMAFKRASDAWRALEEMCSPRGSGEAWRLWCQLHSITLQGCGGNVAEYVSSLEQAYLAFGRLKTSGQALPGRPRIDPSPLQQHQRLALAAAASQLGTGANVMSEDALCFLFLQGLGPEYKRWIETLCATNNVGGFGTGAKVGFREVTRRAVEFEGMRKSGRAG